MDVHSFKQCLVEWHAFKSQKLLPWSNSGPKKLPANEIGLTPKNETDPEEDSNPKLPRANFYEQEDADGKSKSMCNTGGVEETKLVGANFHLRFIQVTRETT